MRVNISWNPNESFNLPGLQDCIKFTQLHFSWLWYTCKYSGKWMYVGKNGMASPADQPCIFVENSRFWSQCNKKDLNFDLS